MVQDCDYYANIRHCVKQLKKTEYIMEKIYISIFKSKNNDIKHSGKTKYTAAITNFYNKFYTLTNLYCNTKRYKHKKQRKFIKDILNSLEINDYLSFNTINSKFYKRRSMRNTLEKEYIVRLNFHNETVWKIFYSKKPENLVELKSNESFRQFYKLIKKEMDIEFIDNIIFNIKKFGQSNKSNDLRHGIQKIEKKIKKTLIYSYDSCFANNSISIYYKQNKSEDCEDEIYILAFKRNILFESDNLERVISRYLAIYLCLKNYRPRNQTKNFYFSLLGFSNLDPDIISDKINVNEAGRTIIKCSNNLYMRFMSLQLL